MSNTYQELNENESTTNVTFSIGSDGKGRYCYDDSNDCVSEDELVYDRGFGG